MFGLGDAYIAYGGYYGMSSLAFKEPSEEEMKKAMAHIDELLADPVKFDKWLDRAIEAWRKKRRNYKR